MKSYLSLVPILAGVHKRQNRMTLLCITIAVFLLTTIFSMADMAVRMEKSLIIKEYGNWHIMLHGVDESDAEYICADKFVAKATRYNAINYKINEDYYLGGKKATMLRIGFLLLLIVTFYILSTVLKVKSFHGVNQTDCFYWQPENSIDVVMMGSSHVHCNINTGLLWEEYGIPAYDYSGAEQPLWMTYYYLQELYKYQNPDVVVLDLFAPARFKEDYQYEWISENIYGMRFSPNKLKMLSVSVEPRKLHDYFPSFLVYHSRYDDLDETDFERFFWNEEHMENFKGYTPYLERNPQVRPVIQEQEGNGLSQKSLDYLIKIIDYVKKQDTTLILIVAPYIVTEEDTKTYNQAAEIAKENDIVFINYNEYYDEIGLDFDTDFNDDSHLNYWGSCKFTQYLGEYLASLPGYCDRRGMEGFESWDKNEKIIRNYVKSCGIRR